MPPDQQYQNPYQPPQQDPNGQYAVMPARPAASNDGHSGHNPYEFIMNGNASPKRSFMGSGFWMRLGLFVGGAAVLLIGIIVVLSSIAPKGSLPGMLTMTSRQAEILRVVADADKKATGQDTLNFAATVEAAITTDKLRVSGFVLSHGGKITPQILAADFDSDTDKLLQSALSTNMYDTAITKNLVEQLEDYQALALSTYKQAGNEQAKAMLKTTYANATKLLQQAKAISAN